MTGEKRQERERETCTRLVRVSLERGEKHTHTVSLMMMRTERIN